MRLSTRLGGRGPECNGQSGAAGSVCGDRANGRSVDRRRGRSAGRVAV